VISALVHELAASLLKAGLKALGLSFYLRRQRRTPNAACSGWPFEEALGQTLHLTRSRPSSVTRRRSRAVAASGAPQRRCPSQRQAARDRRQGPSGTSRHSVIGLLSPIRFEEVASEEELEVTPTTRFCGTSGCWSLFERPVPPPTPCHETESRRLSTGAGQV